MFLLGYDGMPRRVAELSGRSAGQNTLNLISTIGACIIGRPFWCSS